MLDDSRMGAKAWRNGCQRGKVATIAAVWARPGTIVSWLAKEATVLRVTSQTSSLLLQGEEVLAVAVANTVLGYLPSHYAGVVPDLRVRQNP